MIKKFAVTAILSVIALPVGAAAAPYNEKVQTLKRAESGHECVRLAWEDERTNRFGIGQILSPESAVRWQRRLHKYEDEWGVTYYIIPVMCEVFTERE